MKIGVLCIQGAVREHAASLNRCGVNVVCVKKSEQIADLDGLIIPGGESTTIGKLINRFNLAPAILEMIQSGKPVYGTCAGLILLSKHVEGSDQFILGQMNITVARNAFGRQRDSFETDLHIPALGEEPFRAVFIRAPLIRECGEGVETVATCGTEIVAARQGNILVSAFHPELTDDDRMHRYFIAMANECKN